MTTKFLALRRVKKRNNICRKTISCKIRKSKIIFSFFALFLVCTLGFIYISKINNVSTKGYEIESYKKKVRLLEKENQRMAVDLADLRAIDTLENKNSHFAAIDYQDVTYIVSTSSMVAME